MGKTEFSPKTPTPEFLGKQIRIRMAALEAAHLSFFPIDHNLTLEEQPEIVKKRGEIRHCYRKQLPRMLFPALGPCYEDTLQRGIGVATQFRDRYQNYLENPELQHKKLYYEQELNFWQNLLDFYSTVKPHSPKKMAINPF